MRLRTYFLNLELTSNSTIEMFHYEGLYILVFRTTQTLVNGFSFKVLRTCWKRVIYSS